MKRVDWSQPAAAAVLACWASASARRSKTTGARHDGGRSREQSFSVAEAGAVTVTVQSGRITVISIQRVEGWTPKVVRQSGPSVRVEFVKGANRRVFVARFANGELVTRVRRVNGQTTSSSSLGHFILGDIVDRGHLVHHGRWKPPRRRLMTTHRRPSTTTHQPPSMTT